MHDACPFVLARPVIETLRFAHCVIAEAGAARVQGR
jgi:hypothetical protein